jgi:deoxyribodipyrimidine photo-lyase
MDQASAVTVGETAAVGVVVMWFRRDLRLSDHPALCAAAASGEVLPLFVVDPAFAAGGEPRRATLRVACEALNQSMGDALVYRHGDPREVVPTVAREVGATEVYVTRDYGPYGRRRDAEVRDSLAADGRRLVGVGGPYAQQPGAVVKSDGRPYAVFTPFRRAWRALPLDGPQPMPKATWRSAPSDAPPSPAASASTPVAQVGELAAFRRWVEFRNSGLGDYAATRNLPGIAGTSRLSADLRWGTLHPRQLLAELAGDESHDVFASELVWREFYADVLFHQPQTAHRNLNASMDALPVDTDASAQKRFTAWCDGMTGFPLVDAGMRELRSTGWMHNRVRMITGSFLVKDLHLPWQWGAKFFMQHLVDGDLASNSHGWQWVAGTGTDAAPFFRVFNPIAQSERFDPEGTYIRRWVPELLDVVGPAIHDPGVGRPDSYPPKMVDHQRERADALARYSAARTANGAGSR